MCSKARKTANKPASRPKKARERAEARASVCTPTYQGLDKLKRTLPVLVGELGPDDELIYVVDGSTDGSIEFLQHHAAQDDRIRLVVLETNQGRTAAVNVACRAASGRIVIRTDDDIIVSEGFVDAHVTAHESAARSVGAVQRIVDVGDSKRGGMWPAFVERNATRDRDRYQAQSGGAPACTWGAVCSVRREVGEALGWYDERFAAYGWEDVEFGYRLVSSGVPIVMLDAPQVEHLAEATTFSRKLARGFDAGARMGVFAEIHSSEAVLVALGLDPTLRARPRSPMGSARRALLGDGVRRRMFCTSARVGETLLGAVRWRRGYDAWVARWLSWSYACGWRDEADAMSLPLIEPPTAWPSRTVFTERERWCSLVTASDVDGTSSEFQPILRSALLRESERHMVSAFTAWRHAAGAVRRLVQSVAGPAQLDGWTDGGDGRGIVFFEESTPSFTDGLIKAIDVFRDAGVPIVALAGSARVSGDVAKRSTFQCTALEDVCPAPHLGILAIGGAWARALKVVSRLEKALSRRPWSAAARVQLVAEAAVSDILRQRTAALQMLRRASFVLSVSEYFAASSALRASARAAEVPWVTLQHGIVNMVYAPFSADEYWVWSDEAQTGLERLQPAERGSVSIVGSPMEAPERPDEERAALILQSCGLESWSGPVVCLFSQGHGPEFSAATHYDLAGQLRRLLEAVPDAFLLVKRHPSEPESIYSTLTQLERCVEVPDGVSSVDVASVCSVAVALGSTALIEAMLVGCVAVEVSTGEALIEQAVATTQVPLSDVAAVVGRIVGDSHERAAVLRQQDAQRERFIGPDDFASRIVARVAVLRQASADVSA